MTGSPLYAASAEATRIAYETAGSGPPVVIVGGAFGTRVDARELAEALSGRFTAACYDRRTRRIGVRVRALVRWVLSLDAAAAGLPIPKFGVYEAPFTNDDSRPPYHDGFVETLRGLVQSGRRADAVAEFYRTGLLMPEPVIEQQRQASDWPPLESLAHTLLYDFEVRGDRISGRPLPASMADSIMIPVLILSGGDSPPALRNPASSLAALLPKATHRTLAGQGHGAPAEVLAPILESFFRD